MAKEMDVEKATAAWVIRDVTIGRDCEFSPLLALAQMIPWQSACLNYLCATDSFLMDAFDPKYLYW